MSTPAYIFIHIKPEDKGSVRKCDVNKIHLRTVEDVINANKKIYPKMPEKELKDIIDFSIKIDNITNADIVGKKFKRVTLPEYLCIYHHWDGYPDRLGEELKKNYSSYEDALNLCLAGNFSSILDGSVPYMMKDRNADWEDNKPVRLKNVPKSVGSYFDYLFDNGKWYVRDKEDPNFREF